MKTFKQHIKEGGTMGVGTPHQSSVEDGSMGAHNIHEPAILQRVNAFVGSIADKEYIQPEAALSQLETRLKTIGVYIKTIGFYIKTSGFYVKTHGSHVKTSS